FGFAENTDDLFVGKTLLHGDVLMWLMKTLLTSGCTNQRGAGQLSAARSAERIAKGSSDVFRESGNSFSFKGWHNF
ncbi:hypothetical protein, partial [Enterobacter cloacae]|uniref:hypothetical protein n=1 Tax=Enterobacter cloacae TaxID=550 RepID=UPI0019D44A13